MKLIPSDLKLKIAIITLLLGTNLILPETLSANGLKGSIQGRVLDADSKIPLAGTNVSVNGTQMGSATDVNGQFSIKNVPVGSYVLRFDYIGYETQRKTDIIIRSNRITYVNAELKMSALEGEAVSVSAGYFTESKDQPTSVIGFSAEEIRRAPGSAGDVSRILMSLPSVAKVNDQSNSLIVRGGSPIENSFYIDNIEIPNINHYPTQGASGGPIGMVNVDFIQDVDFYTGGFASVYGDKLSSIMDMTFREGNREEFDAQLDLNFAGFGGAAEGPLFNGKGSWLFSARRSFLDLLIKAFSVGTTTAPRYGDYQGKLVYDINPDHKLIALGVWGDDHISSDIDIARENDMIVFGGQDINENTTGLNWRALWSKNFYSNTAVSFTSTKYKEDFFETNSSMHLTRNRSLEQNFKFRNVNHLRLNNKNTLEFGVDAKHLVSDYDNFFAEYTDALGDTTPPFFINNNFSSNKVGVFVNYIAKPCKRTTTTLGVRTDYSSYNEKSTVSPRFAVSVRLSDRTSLNASTGLYTQSLPLLLLAQNPGNKKLAEPRAAHYILGIDHLLTENTKFTVEVYQKDYSNFPIDPSQPSLFLIDELFYRYGFFFNHAEIVANGKAYSRGVELTLQKKLAQDFYGLMSFSYFRTRYRGGDGVWRNRVFDNRYVFSAEGGYKPNNKWEFSCRWIIAGGVPYTPFDLEASRAINREVQDGSRINEARYPAYHSLNLRFDRRFNFSSTNLVFYFSVWNAYNHKNIATYFWNENENKQGVTYQWTMLPIFGLEYEF